jgi:hypothetical protein
LAPDSLGRLLLLLLLLQLLLLLCIDIKLPSINQNTIAVAADC